MYTAMRKVTKVVNMEAPSLTEYSHLYSTYSQTLTCSSLEILIKYGELLCVKYSLHQVGHSSFTPQYIRSRMTFDRQIHRNFNR